MDSLLVANNFVFASISDTDFSHLFISYNGGDQWQLAENDITFQGSYGGVGHLIGVGGALVASTFGYTDVVFISLDSAQTWLPFNDGLPDYNAGKLVADGSYLYAATNGQGVWRRSLADLNLESVTGKVFLDENNNGIQDNGELPLPGTLLQLENTSGKSVSRNDGSFEIFSSFLQPDVLSVVPPNPYTVANPSSYAVTQSETGKDFGIYFPPGIKDLSVELTHYGVPRPGFTSHYGISYKNVGTTVMNGQVQLTMDAQMNFVSADPAPSQVIGTQLIWDFDNLQLLETRSITVDVLVPASVPNGTELTSTVAVYPIVNDANPTNNQDAELVTVVGSFDPNDKRVEPGESLTLEDLAAGTPLTYTIRFQNTGTYQADRVRIVDQLSQLLDVSTFQFLASSHPCTFDIRGYGLLEFDFDMINLPDSTSNEQASHGFVKFSIRPRTDLTVGKLIQNKASIYFDFNLPIITNQVSTQIIELTQIATEIQSALGLHIFPNPNAGDFTVLLESTLDEALDVAVFDLQGRLVLQKNGLTNQPINLSMPEASSGIYFLKGKSGGKILAGRVLIQR
ncbi:MAG: T9SS type A sorting domain-containing protein [Saprospiraceae bacterium]|nr:T9SS type A sorting domain-containing protein [Saprospiraceae bacterium]MCF8249240.1 T9SS type A sorting domain-containing protein [Saprospiraceae bacterium]MCF8280153.1 T9SS type A sorting domain-containing protein [Bacteroidales bacterium]MCF8311369.1 T9SS type A sorting domain-containing protein [Saprospiraceae bacterium]MCF8442990.1 T9SS type A sorting domain-containing protein [Saprospiraceae bacterium]